MGSQAPIRSSDFIFLKCMWCFEYLSCLSYKSTVSLCFPNRHIGVKSLLLVCLDQNFILINIFECNPSHSFFFFWWCHASYGILVLLPGIRPRPPAVEAWSSNNWTTRELPMLSILNVETLCGKRALRALLPVFFLSFLLLVQSVNYNWSRVVCSTIAIETAIQGTGQAWLYMCQTIAFLIPPHYPVLL